MKQTMVIGLYEDTGQTFTHVSNTDDRQAALREAAKEAGAAADMLIILGTVNAAYGSMSFIAPADSGMGAYATDLLEGAG